MRVEVRRDQCTSKPNHPLAIYPWVSLWVLLRGPSMLLPGFDIYKLLRGLPMSTASFGLIFLLLFPIHYYWSGCWMSSLSLLALIFHSALQTCQSNVSDHDWLPSTHTDRREGAMSSLRLTDFIPYSPNRLYFFVCKHIAVLVYSPQLSITMTTFDICN